MDELKPPEDRLTITYKGEEKELFMSFLRLNSCQRVVGNADRVALMMIDPDVGEMLVKAMVADKGGAGHMFDVELADGDLSTEDFDRILLWVQEHLTSFFIRRLQAASKNAKTLSQTVAALRLSEAGSET